jgi:hypothetical protein
MVLISILVGVVLFLGLFALIGISYRGLERNGASPANAHEHSGGLDDACVLCHAPLPHLGTPAAAVTEIERRIADDRREVNAGGVRILAPPVH